MASTSAAPAEPEVLQQQTGQLAILTLNRPKALNALTTGMVEDVYKTLKDYENNPSIAAVLINGAGGKAFCAGGDVKAVVQMSEAGKIEEAMRFFRSEYHLNYKIATFKKPYIALLDGITMGGGVGVSVHGTFRIATERTVFAMPECAIGLIPDVGGSYFLPRLVPDGSLGLYIGLTGCRLKVRVIIIHLPLQLKISYYILWLSISVVFYSAGCGCASCRACNALYSVFPPSRTTKCYSKHS
jgi:enoyl-CoA hydratase/carnithine racemase